MSIVKRIGRKLGVRFKPPMLAERFPQYDIGRGSYGNLKVIDYGEGTKLRMGRYCSVADGAQILLGGGHRDDWVTTYPLSVLEPSLTHIEGHPTTRGDVIIGSDVWLASDCKILSGVTIGHGAIVTANALVTRDVEPYAIVGGVPAKPIRKRFDDATIGRLLAVAWWNWPHDRVVAAGPHMLSKDIGDFLDKAEAGEL